MSSANSESFTSSFPIWIPFISFSALISVAKLPKLCGMVVVRMGTLVLFLTLGESPSPSSTGKTVNLVSFQKCVSLEIMILFCVCAKSLSHVQLFVTSWTVAHRTPLPMEFSSQEYLLSGLPCPPPGEMLQLLPFSWTITIPLTSRYFISSLPLSLFPSGTHRLWHFHSALKWNALCS